MPYNVADRIGAAKAARLKHRELDALVHQLPHDHPLRGAMRHTLSKLWMFTGEAFDEPVATALRDQARAERSPDNKEDRS